MIPILEINLQGGLQSKHAEVYYNWVRTGPPSIVPFLAQFRLIVACLWVVELRIHFGERYQRLKISPIYLECVLLDVIILHNISKWLFSHGSGYIYSAVPLSRSQFSPKSSQYTPHSSPVKASYGVSVVNLKSDLQHMWNYIHQHRPITTFWLVFSTFLYQKLLPEHQPLSN